MPRRPSTLVGNPIIYRVVRVFSGPDPLQRTVCTSLAERLCQAAPSILESSHLKNLKNLRDVLRPAARNAASNDHGSGVVGTLRRALAFAGIGAAVPRKEVSHTIEKARASATPCGAGTPTDGGADTIDGEAREILPEPQLPRSADAPDALPEADAPPAAEAPHPSGGFSTHTFSNDAGTRRYKLYVPARRAAATSAAMPLVVMLHGCTQTSDDFAVGTQMNPLADDHGFLVVYPEQAANANGSHCWNWFRTEDQQRDAGEPSLIAGITREVAAAHAVDPGRIFVCGLSAGASMAVILGVTYPDVFAAVGAHSGLPYAAAHDMGSAFAAMQSGSPASAVHNWPHAPGATGRNQPDALTLPTIVFHGDHDATVAARNGAQIVEQATRGRGLETLVLQGGTRDRHFTRTIHRDRSGRHVVEHWLIKGAGHTWSGGNPRGSFTDASGPDASAEMIRFFLDQPSVGAG